MQTIVEEIARAIGERVPMNTRGLEPLAKKVQKKATQDIFRDFSPEAKEWINLAKRALANRGEIPIPEDFHVDLLLSSAKEIDNGDLEEEFEAPPPDLQLFETLQVASIGQLVKDKKDKYLVTPDFQRDLVWNKEYQQAFIRSQLVNVPTPSLFFAIDPLNSTQHFILDGFQRMSTYEAFMDNKLSLGEGEFYRNARYCDLPETVAFKFKNKKIGFYEITSERKHWPYIFRQINKANMQLNSIELRRATYINPTFQLLDTFAKSDTHWPALYGRNTRYKGLQAILRAVAMHYDYSTYTKPMDTFLDRFCNTKVTGAPEVLNVESLGQFHQRLSTVSAALHNHVGKVAFRMAAGKPVNMGVLDCVMHAALLLVEHNPEITHEEIGSKIKVLREKLIDPNSPAYLALTKDTSGKDAVLTRLSAAEALILI